MATQVLGIKMKFRNKTVEELRAVINDENSSEMEVKIAKEMLEKKGESLEEEAPKKPVKKVALKKTEKQPEPEPEEEAEEETDEEAVPEEETEGTEELSPAEKARLAKAEKEFDKRQKNRKTPSKSDKQMAGSEKQDKAPRETKRKNLEESTEVPGLKVGSKVTLKESEEVGEVVRLYQSGDGKEKCMVKFGENKPIKKRVTALELVSDTPSKKNAVKKK